MYVFQWRVAIPDDNSASICTIPPGYNRNLTKLQAVFRVVDNSAQAQLHCVVMKALLGSVIVIAVLTCASAQVQRPGLKVGDRAPDFSLPNPDGKPITLKDYTSRGPVVVIFYRGFW